MSLMRLRAVGKLVIVVVPSLAGATLVVWLLHEAKPQG